jgi:hypothetical protein
MRAHIIFILNTSVIKYAVAILNLYGINKIMVVLHFIHRTTNARDTAVQLVESQNDFSMHS